MTALSDHFGREGALRSKSYLTEDKRWAYMASFAGTSMRLSAYAGALANLSAQATERGVTQEDRLFLTSLLLTIAGFMWKLSTRAALATTRC